MDRFVCIHGHFYQPPRENPWLESIELQDSAYPYHDWNERITAECYEPNSAARILDGDGQIVRIVNSYSNISFNFGPTLLAWLQSEAPNVYASVIAADRESAETFSGHGSAMAQCYNHIIMPLANSRDKRTQVIWGLRDFEHRFGRKAEGIWLPETAVDVETLDILAEQGVRFTVLAPHQAGRVRKLGDRSWTDVSGATIDPTRAYTQRLPSGRSIALFFYDGPVSRAVAFEGLLTRGETLAHRITDGFSNERTWPQLMHIATDGESYGHHHRHGDMALAYAIDYIRSENLARITNYGEFLELNPPTHEVEIIEDTSWSCAHGIERWRSNCGCNSGGRPGWNQEWRAPLRSALDWLRESVATAFERHAAALFVDPWAARDDYVAVVLDRSEPVVDAFFERNAKAPLSDDERLRALKLMELQRHAMLMYTSCGWFFDELSGIETVQVIAYAGRVVQLAQEILGDGTEEEFLARLEQAKSNLREHRDGRNIYDKWVKSAVVDIRRAGAHYAVSSLFEEYEDEAHIHCYRVEREDYATMEAGLARLAIGRSRIVSDLTGETANLTFGVVHFGDHNLTGGVREFRGEELYREMVAEVGEAFGRADLPEVIRLLDKHFLELTFSLKSIFRDEQRKVLNLILASTLSEAEATYRQLYDHHAPLMRFLTDVGSPLPKAFAVAAELTLNANLRLAVQELPPVLDHIQAHLSEMERWQFDLDTDGLAYTLHSTLQRLTDDFEAAPDSIDNLRALDSTAALVHEMPFEVDLWRAQNAYYTMLQTLLPEHRKRAERQDGLAQEWVDLFVDLGRRLSVRVE